MRRFSLPEFIDNVQDQAQDNADDYTGDYGKMKTEVFPLDGDISREPPEIFEEGDGIPENQDYAGKDQ
jgi:hypothetical protein